MPQQNQTWDLGRFVKTLSYYGAIPFLSDLDWFQEWFGSRPQPKVDTDSMITSSDSTMNDATTILVVGSGTTAQQVTQRLAEKSPGTRVLSWMPNQPLPPAVQITAILIDAADSTAQIVQALANYDFGQAFQPLFDFTRHSSDLKEVWGALDDVVMGGVSESNIRFKEAIAEFSGNVSVANSGGFASVRTRNFEPAIDLSSCNGVVLRVRGDGNRYKFMLRTESRWDGIAHCHSFDTIVNNWITVSIPFTEFVPVLRAKTVANAPLDPHCVNAFQLMLSKFEYDGALNPHFQPGAFQLQIESIQGYKQAPVPNIVVVNDNSQIDDELRQSGIPYTIVRPSESAVDLCLKSLT